MMDIGRESFERVVPAFKTPTGEVFNKVERFVKEAAAEWDSVMVEGAKLSAVIEEKLKVAICSRAAYNAVPHLDLVLTPTGFGIVSNQNTAPASKERVGALREQLRMDASRMEDDVMEYLAWENLMVDRQLRVRNLLWTASLMDRYGIRPNDNVLERLFQRNVLWQTPYFYGYGARTKDSRRVYAEERQELMTAMHDANARLVDVISPELNEALIAFQYGGLKPKPDDAILYAMLLEKARYLLAAYVMQQPTAHFERQLLDMLMKHAAEIPEFYNSRTYEAYKVKAYENGKDDTCYFFC